HVPANAAIFRPPNAVWTIPEQRFGFACINLHAELLPRDTRYDGFAWRPVPVLPSIAEVLDQLRVATARVRDHRVVALIETLFHAGLARSGERFAGEPNTARRAREFLEIAYTTNPSLHEIAAAAGINRFALVRLFRRAYGITPHAFQIRLKVRHAQRMLAAGHDLSYVAATVGFADLSHLTRHFRRVLGVTPGAFARNLQFHSMR
ncbi:MAG: helix-turn-helix domain-containing protein, partial [Deltaproteobacteria bacterium]|nr:helix-turn-helix domain-containing protein [Nannocystaceae bacterium]